jgi:hypothetical protein
MAPEFPVFLLAFTLRMEATSLIAELENVERAGNARIRARWSERSPAHGFRPVGGGVLHVEETTDVLFLEPRQVQLDELGNSRYRWIQGTPADVPFVMIAVVFPRGYTFRAPNVPPESSKVFNGQISAYWCLRGNDLGRTLLEWTVLPLERSADDEVRFLNGRSTLEQLPGAAAIDVDTPRSPLNVGLSIFICHSSQDKPYVREIYRQLKKDGHVPWLDEEDILPGEKWETAITDAVRSSNVVLVCLSKQSINKEGFLQKEISEVLQVAEEKPEGTIFVIPLRLEEAPVPRRLSQWQWLDYFHESAHKRLLCSLAKRAAQLPRV